MDFKPYTDYQLLGTWIDAVQDEKELLRKYQEVKKKREEVEREFLSSCFDSLKHSFPVVIVFREQRYLIDISDNGITMTEIISEINLDML